MLLLNDAISLSLALSLRTALPQRIKLPAIPNWLQLNAHDPGTDDDDDGHQKQRFVLSHVQSEMWISPGFGIKTFGETEFCCNVCWQGLSQLLQPHD